MRFQNKGQKDLIKRLFCLRLSKSFFYVPGRTAVFLVGDLMNGGVPSEKTAFYAIGFVLCVSGLFCSLLIFSITRPTLPLIRKAVCDALRWPNGLRKIPLSLLWEKDLADLTSTIMADCTFLEQSFFSLYS